MERRIKPLHLSPLPILFISLFLLSHSLSFQSDELLLDDEDFGLEGGIPPPEIQNPNPSRPSTPTQDKTPSPIRRTSSDSDSDSKVQFTLDHAFGDSDFSPAGVFTARLKSWPHGGQTLTKLRFSRNALSETEQEKFKGILREDEFYRVRLPSNVLSPPGRNYTVSSIKARCLPRDSLDEHIVLHMEGINIVAVNYGSTGACSHPRPLKFPSKWSFNSHTILKYSEQASRAPTFTEQVVFGGENIEDEAEKPPERSLWAKYWMYLVPLGLVLINAMSQAMNMPEEQADAGGQGAMAAARGTGPAVRRR